jgi:hypothetical protein
VFFKLQKKNSSLNVEDAKRVFFFFFFFGNKCCITKARNQSPYYKGKQEREVDFFHYKRGRREGAKVSGHVV